MRGQSFNPQAILFGKSDDSEGDVHDGDDTEGGEDMCHDEKYNQASDKPALGDVETNTDTKTNTANTKTNTVTDTENIPDTNIHGTSSCARPSTAKTLLEVFIDEDRFFLDANGTIVEAHFNPKTKAYRLADRRPLDLDLMPDSPDSYDEFFKDGIYHSKNKLGHWRVGTIVPSVDTSTIHKTKLWCQTLKHHHF
jgi:hypothetical protein